MSFSCLVPDPTVATFTFLIFLFPTLLLPRHNTLIILILILILLIIVYDIATPLPQHARNGGDRPLRRCCWRDPRVHPHLHMRLRLRLWREAQQWRARGETQQTIARGERFKEALDVEVGTQRRGGDGRGGEGGGDSGGNDGGGQFEKQRRLQGGDAYRQRIVQMDKGAGGGRGHGGHAGAGRGRREEGGRGGGDERGERRRSADDGGRRGRRGRGQG